MVPESFRRSAFGALFLLAATSFLGCGSERVDIRSTNVSIPPLSASVVGGRISLVHGIAIRARISAFVGESESDEPESAYSVASADSNVVQVARGPFDKEYVFVGVREGRTTVTFYFRGEPVAEWPAEVVVQVVGP
ncbi:MAG: hypothetical protein U0169_09140 [Polyangiaceae bacterium]